MLHGRAVPGYNNLFAVIGAPHMPMGVGTVLRLDIDHPIRTREPMTYITPDVDVRTEFGFSAPQMFVDGAQTIGRTVRVGD